MYEYKDLINRYSCSFAKYTELKTREDNQLEMINLLLLLLYNYITSVFHWNVTIWLVMKWSHDYKRDVLHPNKIQTRTCTCLHDDVRPGFLEKNLSLYLSFCSDSKKYLSWDFSKIPFIETNLGKTQLSLSLRIILMFVRGQPGNPPNFRDKNIVC